ncbi:tol-pal system YbgF family protein [candidate division KSB1 bacterium]
MKFSGFKTVLLIVMTVLFISCASSRSTFDSEDIDKLRQKNESELTDIDKLRIELSDKFAKAERYLSLGQFEGALDIAQSVINDYPETEYSDKALFMKGIILSSVLNFNRDLKKAAAAFRMVIATDPVTEYDKLAEIELEKIKKQI